MAENGPDPGVRRFANPDVVVRSWYVVGPSSLLRPGTAKTLPLLGRRIAVYRDTLGRPHALDARCPHLGADLGEGSVDGDAIRCPLHAWCFGPGGTCRDAPGQPDLPARRARPYAMEERWGHLWLFNGPEPDFPLPAIPNGVWRWHPPPQHILAHPHLVVGNGLDATHFPVLHRMEFGAEPVFEQDATSVTLTMVGRPKDAWVRRLTGTSGRDFRASFTTIGGSMAVARVEEPIRTTALFTGRPAPDGGCDTRTFLFFSGRSPLLVTQSLMLWIFLLREDRRILDTMDFRRAFTPSDEGLARLSELIDTMAVY